MSRFRELGPDAWAALVGLVLVAAGVGAIYWPAALIVVGLLLLGLAVWGG